MNPLRTILALCLYAVAAFGAEPPPLEREEAKLIMEAMEWQEVTVIAIQQGVDCKGAAVPICATVVGLGKRRTAFGAIKQTLYYDKELGWHLVEVAEKTARLWTKAGYREISPWTLYGSQPQSLGAVPTPQ